MNSIEALPRFRHYSAPREHGSALIEPSLSRMGEVISHNRDAIAKWDLSVGEFALNELRRNARHDLLVAALHHTSGYCNVPDEWSRLLLHSDLTQVPFVLAGHQPELFHPGVWFKNFALDRIAQDNHAVAVNLVVDNDLRGTASIRVPSLRDGALTRVAVPYDQPASQPIPFEQSIISDQATFRSFADRVTSELAGVVDEPTINRLWPFAMRAAEQCGNVGCALALARHSLEAELGLRTLEVPLSVICQSPAFAAFSLMLLRDLPRLHRAYNASLNIYRTAHGIRSTAHPVPALDQDGEWYEAPLWIYGDDDPRRRPAWARISNNVLEISDRKRRSIKLSLSRDPAHVTSELLAALGRNLKLRPRALVTTMFARVVLSDLFLHGIGGAKYDQLGDMIAREFLGIEPPRYGVISATVLLPGAHSLVQSRSVADVQADLRATRFAPEKFADRVKLAEDLLDRKQALLASVPPRGQKREWHRELMMINQALATQLGEVASQLRTELESAQAASRERANWVSREHSFAVFPLEYMQDAFDSLLMT